MIGDRARPILEANLVPSSVWEQNVRTEYPGLWPKIRLRVLQEAGYACAVCGRKKTRLDCHEVWRLEDAASVSRLIGFQALCVDCHRVKHLGRAFMVGDGELVIRHLMKVNGMSWAEAEEYVRSVMSEWEIRNRKRWYVDLGYVRDYVTERRIAGPGCPGPG